MYFCDTDPVKTHTELVNSQYQCDNVFQGTMNLKDRCTQMKDDLVCLQ